MLHTCVSKGYIRRSKSQLNLTKYSRVMMILEPVLSQKVIFHQNKTQYLKAPTVLTLILML